MVGLRRLEAPVQSWRKGPWTAEEDKLLTEHVNLHREGRWSSVARSTGLNRSGKSCRLRWVNYLRPGLKKGQLTPQEEGIIIELHALWGNKWSAIAQCLPGRTDNEIKNYWRTHFKNKEKSIESLEKQRNRILRQQQQQLQQNQQELEQQQQGPEMNMSISQIKEGDERVSQAQGREENMVFMYPSTLEDQCFLPVMFQDFATMSNTLEEEALWDGLWNLYDIHDHVDHTCANNHASNNLYK